MARARRWRVLDPSLRWYQRQGEDELVAFSPKSGSLHLLTPAVRPLLEAMASAPRTVEEVAALLAASGDASAEQAASIVDSLDSAGLIEPAP